MSFAEFKPDFDRDGFVVVREFLTSAEFVIITTSISGPATC